MKNKGEPFKNVPLGPFRYLTPSVRAESYAVLALLSVQVVMLVITKSYGSLAVLLAALLASAAAEMLGGMRVRLGAYCWANAAIRGTLVAFLLPASYPPATVFLVTFLVLAADRCILGGHANSWVNAACAAVAVCWLIGMEHFPVVPFSVDDLRARNTALTLIQGGTFPVMPSDARITNVLNDRVFRLFGVSIPDGYVSLFWDSHAAIPAFRFNFLTLLSSLVLIAFGFMSPVVPGVFLLVYALLVRLASPFFSGGPAFQGDVLLALLTSGTLFCTVFLMQWHGTVPLTARGRVMYGAAGGIIAFLIVGVGASAAGFAFTILSMNVLSPLVQSVENHIEGRKVDTEIAAKVALVLEGRNA